MTNEQKTQILSLRNQGKSLADVADRLGLPIGTVKSFWRRHCASTPSEMMLDGESPQSQPHVKDGTCKQCGVPLEQSPHHRPKLFCSDKCRLTWWHDNRHLAKGAELKMCPSCGVTFTAGAGRKYCCHSCYIKARYATTKQPVGGAATI